MRFSSRASATQPRRIALIFWALAFLILGSAQVQARRGMPQILLLRLEGRVRDPRPDDKGTTDLTLDARGKPVRFQLTDLRVMNGGALPGDILSRVSPYRPNMFLYGEEAQLGRLGEAKADDLVQIVGYFRGTNRALMVNEVTIVGAPTPAAVATPAS